MTADYLRLYGDASAWTVQKVAGATDLEARTPCDDWRLRDLLNHLLDTQNYFLKAARGEEASPPGPTPPDVLGSDPELDFERVRTEVLEAFSVDGVIERTGPALGIAFSDMLLHGWDVARATGQDATMPEALAEVAYATVHGRFTDEQRQGVFKPEISVDANASWQQRLLAYTGRQPE